MKMPKAKPIAKLVDTCLRNSPKMKATNNELEHNDYELPQEM